MGANEGLNDKSLQDIEEEDWGDPDDPPGCAHPDDCGVSLESGGNQ
jgi:hypothetical protein